MTPFVRSELVGKPDPKEWAALYGITPQEAADAIAYVAGDEVYINNLYQVNVRRHAAVDAPDLVHLSIKRRDKQPVTDWRHKQEIKNRFVGPECEGVEIFPAESRLVDTANQYHIWVIDDPTFRYPFGFGERLVRGTAGCGAVQRPFEEGAAR